MKNKKGFTLIELLAIIVILAIIAVITVPIILDIIDNSKKGAVTDSAYGYKDAVNKWYVSKLQDDNNYRLNGNYNVSDGKLNNIDIPVSGDKPTNGTLTYSNNVLTGGCLTIGEYKVTFDSKGSVSKTEKGECPSAEVYYSFTTDECEDFPCNTEKSNTIDENWTVYIKENTQTNKSEICGVFANGTVCLEANKWETSNNQQATPYAGDYIHNKKTEFENAIGGGFTCELDDGSDLNCDTETVSCYAHESGYVYCGDYSVGRWCFVDMNDQTGCHWW